MLLPSERRKAPYEHRGVKVHRKGEEVVHLGPLRNRKLGCELGCKTIRSWGVQGLRGRSFLTLPLRIGCDYGHLLLNNHPK